MKRKKFKAMTIDCGARTVVLRPNSDGDGIITEEHFGLIPGIHTAYFCASPGCRKELTRSEVYYGDGACPRCNVDLSRTDVVRCVAGHFQHAYARRWFKRFGPTKRVWLDMPEGAITLEEQYKIDPDEEGCS